MDDFGEFLTVRRPETEDQITNNTDDNKNEQRFNNLIEIKQGGAGALLFWYMG